MAFLEYPFVIGTAGHIDHGKTALVKRLTGVDCDRLSEEKRRGMTIELGFAPFTLPSGKTVSIIDVPGHEKFIRQMAAGAAGIDAVMLVIAADDGVMPQTREHLSILSLLGVKEGLTVINKTDLVDSETLEMAIEDAKALLSGTFLENRPIVPVSAATGAGIEELAEKLREMTENAAGKSREGPFFLPVDRAFHIAGFGTVVTGTAINGEIHEGDEVEILPKGQISKIRSLQVHGEPVKTATAGQRTAANLAGVALDEVRRGDVVAAKGRFTPSRCLDASVEVLKDAEPLKHWQRFRLHLGTADTAARISLLDRKEILPGEKAIAQIITEEPVVASLKSRFILRAYSPLVTSAGGRILMPSDERPKNRREKNALAKFLEKLTAEPPLKERITALIDRKEIITAAEAARMNEITPTELLRAVSPCEARGEIGVTRGAETTLISRAKLEELAAALRDALELFHKAHPERKGMPLDECAKTLGDSGAKLARELLPLLSKRGIIKFADDRAALPGFEPFDEEAFAREVAALRAFALTKGWAMPTIEEARAALSFTPEQMTRVLSYLREKKELAIVTGGFLLLPETEAAFMNKIASLEGDITLAAMRDATGSSRKYSLPLLEYFDSKGITRRVGDRRILMKK